MIDPDYTIDFIKLVMLNTKAIYPKSDIYLYYVILMDVINRLNNSIFFYDQRTQE